jgi:ABC-2 type transport system permease protein
MKHVASVAGRELRGLFLSPIAWGVLALFSVLAGLFFILNLAWFSEQILQLQQFQAFDRLEAINLNDQLIREFYGSMSVILLFLVPGITMGLFAAEKTNGTQELLLTSPLTVWDIVLGKFLAGALFIGVLALIVGLYPLLLFVYGDPELGKTLTGLAAVVLVGWTYVAIGAFASSLTRSQAKPGSCWPTLDLTNRSLESLNFACTLRAGSEPKQLLVEQRIFNLIPSMRSIHI